MSITKQHRPLAAGLAALAVVMAPALAGAAPAVPTNLAGVFTRLDVPRSFDPLSASPQALEANGFPPRPDMMRAPHAYDAWRRAVTAGARRVMPTLHRGAVQHRPKLARGRANGTDYSSNWSGYAVVNGASHYGSSSFYFVMGDYAVPRVTQAVGACTGSWDYASAWVGMDGYGSGDVLQAGVDADAYCGGGGTAAYYAAWYEWYPNYEVEIGGLSVSPGDDMFVEVWSSGPTSAGTYLVDYDSNQAVELGFGPPAGVSLIGNSAEWIVERPGFAGGGLATLSDYSQDFFADGYAGNLLSQVSEPNAAAAGATTVPIVMLDDAGAVISGPTPLGTTGIWFGVAGSAHTAGAP